MSSKSLPDVGEHQGIAIMQKYVFAFRGTDIVFVRSCYFCALGNDGQHCVEGRRRDTRQSPIYHAWRRDERRVKIG